MIRIICDVCKEEKSTLSSLEDKDLQCCRECRDLITPVLFKGVFSLKEAQDTMEFIRFTNKSMDAMFTYARKKAIYLHESYDENIQKIIDTLKLISIEVLRKELFTLNMREHQYVMSMYMSNEINNPLYDVILDTTINDNIELMLVKQSYVKKFTSWKLCKF